MPKYKFTDQEKESLKVAKLNQDKSQALQSEMDVLKKNWTESNNKDEEFLSSVEKKLGITDPVKIDKKATFTRESKHVEEIDWFDLIAEAEEEYHDDISFEDLLNQEEFSKVYAKVKEIDKEFEKKTGIREKDFAFLGIAIALQCVRQYVLDPLLKKNRKGASANDEKGRKGKAEPGWYYVETDKILNNSVPFDVQQLHH